MRRWGAASVRAAVPVVALAAMLVACTGTRGSFASTVPGATVAGSTVPATVGTQPSQRPTLEGLAEQCRSAAGAAVKVGGVLATGVDHSGLVDAFQASYPGITVSTDGSGDVGADVVEADPSTAQLLGRSGEVEAFVPSLAGEVLGLVAGSPVWAWSSMVVFAVDRSRVAIVPSSVRELSNPAYAGDAHLVGDPRTDVMARAVVMAASLAAGGSPDDTARGAKYVFSATRAGVFTADSDAPIALGTTASVAATVQQWQEAGREVKLVFPSDGLLGVPFSPLQVRGSSHVACAQSWIEHLLSDDGALSVLLGHGVPARLAQLQQRSLLTSDMVAMVPSAEQWARTVQVTDAQLKTALQPILASPLWK